MHAEVHQYWCPSRVRPMINDKGCRRTTRPGSERETHQSAYFSYCQHDETEEL